MSTSYRGWCFSSGICRGRADQLSVRLHRQRHLPQQRSVRTAARFARQVLHSSAAFHAKINPSCRVAHLEWNNLCKISWWIQESLTKMPFIQFDNPVNQSVIQTTSDLRCFEGNRNSLVHLKCNTRTKIFFQLLCRYKGNQHWTKNKKSLLLIANLNNNYLLLSGVGNR